MYDGNSFVGIVNNQRETMSTQGKKEVILKMVRCTRFWYLMHLRAANALASLRIWAASPDPSLLAYAKVWM